jgi:transposase
MPPTACDDVSSSPWERLVCFMGLDWARDHHQILLLDRQGAVCLEGRIQDDAQGWAGLRQALRQRVGPDLTRVGVAIETCSGPAVERLLEMGCTVFPLNPLAAQRYRQRQAPSGDKSDALDARSFAQALRHDGAAWRPLRPEDPLTQELRLLCRDEVALISQRTALVNQLQAALHEYYPAALEAFDDWTLPSAWAWVEAFPTPQALAAAGPRRWNRFLHTHQLYRPQTYARRLEIFAHAAEFCGTAPVTQAKSRLAVALTGQLRTLQTQIQQYRQAIDALYARHPDHDVFGSLPGAGGKMGPRLLGECGGDPQRFADPDALRCYAGSAPVRFQSGQISLAKFRRACNKHLRQAVHLWVNLSRTHCAWAQAYYQHKRAQGQSHACALRCLAQRWLKILWKMIQTRQPYDEALHARNQVRHGSWVIGLLPSTPAPASTPSPALP